MFYTSLHFTSLHRNTLYRGLSRDLPDLSVLRVSRGSKDKLTCIGWCVEIVYPPYLTSLKMFSVVQNMPVAVCIELTLYLVWCWVVLLNYILLHPQETEAYADFSKAQSPMVCSMGISCEVPLVNSALAMVQDGSPIVYQQPAAAQRDMSFHVSPYVWNHWGNYRAYSWHGIWQIH